MRPLKDLLSFGNTKLPKTTMIFNLTSATDCPSKALGLCKVRKCYALRPECFRPQVLPYRRAQDDYWNYNTGQAIVEDMFRVIDRKRIEPKLFRFNEAGDFRSQEDISKLSVISYGLEKHYNITTYGYSARGDLRFDFEHFKVKSSGHWNGNNGRTIVFNPKKETAPEGYFICPGDCHKCQACTSGLDIAFPEH